MKRIVLLLLSMSCFASSLPKFKNTKEISVKSIPMLKKVTFHTDIILPKGQKINEGSKSKLFIHEEVSKGEFNLIKSIVVNDFAILKGMDIKIETKANFTKVDSKVAISAEVIHCSADNKGSCYIDKFQKILKRKFKEVGKLVEVKLFPTIE